MSFIDRCYASFSWRLSRKIESKPFIRTMYKWFCFTFLKPKDISTIPIIINNRDRYSYLKTLIDWLKSNGYKNYYVLDNDSTYEPLLKYYKEELNDRVIYLNKNAGHLAFWDTLTYVKFKNKFYIYTDSDIVPIENSGKEFLYTLFKALKNAPFAIKAGSAIKINDIPEYYAHKEEVVKHESKFWEEEITDYIYRAPVDTTLALYLPNFVGTGNGTLHLRVAKQCLIKHSPWYEKQEELTEDQRYYYNNIRKSATYWSGKMNPV